MMIKDSQGVVVFDDKKLTEIELLTAKIDKMQATMDQILEIFVMVKDEVTPFLDGLSKSPIVKMLGIKV